MICDLDICPVSGIIEDEKARTEESSFVETARDAGAWIETPAR